MPPPPPPNHKRWGEGPAPPPILIPLLNINPCVDRQRSHPCSPRNKYQHSVLKSTLVMTTLTTAHVYVCTVALAAYIKSILSYFTTPPSGTIITPSSQSIAEPAEVYKNSFKVVEDSHTEQRGSGELVGMPEVIEQANAKRRRMNTDARYAETDQERTSARLVDTIPSVSLSASGINVPHGLLSSELLCW